MGKRLFVGNLPYSATAEELRSLFTPHGEVVDVHLVVDRETSRPRGFGFVSFATDEQAAKAIESLNGRMFGGRPLVVKDARDRNAPAPAGERPPRSFGPRPGGFARPGGGPGRPAGDAGAWPSRRPRPPLMPGPVDLPPEGERRRPAPRKRREPVEGERAPKTRIREEEDVRTGHWRQWMDEYEDTDENGRPLDEGTPEDVGKESAPEDVGKESAPEDVGKESAPEDVSKESAPEDVGKESEPEDVSKESAPGEDRDDDKS